MSSLTLGATSEKTSRHAAPRARRDGADGARRDHAAVDPTLSARADFDASSTPRRREVQKTGACARAISRHPFTCSAFRARTAELSEQVEVIRLAELAAEKSGRIVPREDRQHGECARTSPTQMHNRCHLRRAPSLTENGARGRTVGRTDGPRGRHDRRSAQSG